MTLALPLVRSASVERLWPRIRALNLDPFLVFVMVLAAAIHIPSMDSYFHGDDFVAMTDLVSKPALEHLYNVYTFSDSNFYWRPLGLTYDVMIYQLFGLSTVAFHVGSVLIFEGTILLLYHLCRRVGLPQGVAVTACLIFALFPNHVVSVAWITNTSRLMAVFFVIACLLMLEKASRTHQVSDEAWAFLLFVAAGLSDETALGLAPLPILFALLVRKDKERWYSFTSRALVYTALAASLIPLQFMFTSDDEPRLAKYAFGPHILEQTWALAAQLTLPITSGPPMAQPFISLEPVQWAAGAIAVAAAAMLLIAGSWRMRFLIVWGGLAIAPFTLWDVPYTAPRYVYMAAVPFAIVVAWVLYITWKATAARIRFVPLQYVPVAAAAIALVAYGGITNVDRNEKWEAATAPYEILATQLKLTLPTVEPQSRIIIYYGVWDGFALWPDAVVRTIYKDPTLDAINVVPRNSEDFSPRRRTGDIIVFYTDGRFITVPHSAAWASGR